MSRGVRVIAVINRKGGCGKSTLVRGLASAAIARGAIRGATGDYGYRDDYRDGYRDDYRRDRWRDRYEGRSGYEGDCRTVTIERDDGSVRRIRRCD